MLQQILKDMYIDPDVLEALNEEQKKILFLKMRQEQVRRWKEHEEKLEKEDSAALKPKPRKGPSKNVTWLLGRDGDVKVDIIREVDELQSSPLILPQSSDDKISTREHGILRNSLVKHGTAEPVQSGPDNPPPSGQPGIQLHFKEDNDDDDDDDDDDSEGTGEPPPSYRPHLRFAHTYSIADRFRRPRPSLEQVFEPLSVTEQPSPPPDSQEKDKGKDFRKASTWQRAESEGPGPVAGDPVITRGRVAQLTKTFSVAGTSGTKARVKPPVPNKPAHLVASSSPRHSLR